MDNIHVWYNRRMQVANRKSIPVLLLLLGSTAYCAMQWTYAAKIGPSRIFSSHKKGQREDFGAMVWELTKAIQQACREDSASRFLFDDGDVASSYLKLSHDRISGCVFVRETNVTPFSKEELDNCESIFVREQSSLDGSKLRMYEALSAVPWIETARWVSTDGQFGFALYRHSCFENK